MFYKYIITLQFKTNEKYKFGLFHFPANNTKTAKRNFRYFTKRNCRDIQTISKQKNDKDILAIPLIEYFDIFKVMGGEQK